MKCPKCSSLLSKVVDTREDTSDGTYRWRRRECHPCLHRFTTYEVHSDFMQEARRDKKLLAKDVKMIDQAIAELNKIKREGF